jgi:formate dehydrogenase assembly factor FdhD
MAALEKRREPLRLTGAHQNAIHTASDHSFRDRAQLDDIGRHVAQVAMIGGHAYGAPVAVPVKEPRHSRI